MANSNKKSPSIKERIATKHAELVSKAESTTPKQAVAEIPDNCYAVVMSMFEAEHAANSEIQETLDAIDESSDQDEIAAAYEVLAELREKLKLNKKKIARGHRDAWKVFFRTLRNAGNVENVISARVKTRK